MFFCSVLVFSVFLFFICLFMPFCLSLSFSVHLCLSLYHYLLLSVIVYFCPLVYYCMSLCLYNFHVSISFCLLFSLPFKYNPMAIDAHLRSNLCYWPATNRIFFSSFVRNMFWVTIRYKFHDMNLVWF